MKKNYLITLALYLNISVYSITTPNDNSKIAETRYLTFHSNYFVNLHHFMLHKGALFGFYKNESQRTFDTIFSEVKTRYDLQTKSKLMKALEFYADSLSKKNMLFDDNLTRLKYELQSAKKLESLKTKNISENIINALITMDKFYLENYWGQQNLINQTFVKSKIKSIEKIENQVITNCSKYYGYNLDNSKFRVDLVDYATYFGAYSTTDPYFSATISSSDKRHEGTQGIEVVFHEVSHSMVDSIILIQQNICTKNNLRMDHNIWHSILFYSTGFFVKQALSTNGEEHEMYIDKNKFNDFNPEIKKTLDLIKNNWQKYLNNQLSLKLTVENIILKLEKQ